MYLSHLMIDVGNDPDRPRPGRLWLRDIYQVHQRLLMAFPTYQQRASDPHFLRPFDPNGFERPRLLFRVDSSLEDEAPHAIILVQSQSKPDWDYAFHNARMLLAAEPETRDYNPVFPAGEELRFRIRINLTRKSKRSADGTDLQKHREETDAKGRSRSQSKRVAVTWKSEEGERPDQVVQEWVGSKAGRCGFSLRDFHLLHLGWVIGYRSKARRERSMGDYSGRQLRFRSALLEGTLAITDAPAFAQTVASGIGSAKAFGFGLLSVAPVTL